MEVQKNFLPVKQSRIDEAKRLFNLLYGAVSERKYGYLWAKRADEKITYPFDVSNPHERKAMAQKAIELNDAGFDVYYGVNLMDNPPAPYERATKETVTLQTAIGTDIDVEGGTHTSSEKKKYPSFDVAKGLLPFTPSILINSGYGYHGLNLYDTPITITADNRKLAEQRNKKFIDVIRSRAGIYSKAIDGVGDLPRVLRVPGTRNYKLGISDDAPICHIVEVNDVRFSPEDIDKQLAALKPVQSTKERPMPAPKPVFDFAEDSTDLKEFRIRKMLDCISVVDGEYDKWLDVGFALYNEGLDCSLWEQWSRSQPNFKDGECESKWKGFTYQPGGIKIGSLYQWAVEGGYDAKETMQEWFKLHPELSNKISHAHRADSKNTETGGDLKIFNEQIADGHDAIQQWQVDNGAIDSKLLLRLKTEADRIQNVSDFAAAANDLTTQKFLGAFKHYSFFAHITDKFFIDLKRKKEEVVNKVKEYNSLKKNETLYQQVKNETLLAKIAALEPTDSELALTNIDITAIKNKVSTFETKARKAHKHYLEQKEIDELNAKIQAERDAYEQAPPSTKKLFPDCPIDLILPLGVYADENKGIRIVDFDKPVGRNGRPVIEACQNIVVPIRRFREKIGHGETPKTVDQYEIAIATNTKWNHIIVDGRTILDARSVPALTNFGALITEPKFFAKYMAKIIAINEKNGRLKETVVYTQPGWHGDQFIYPTGGDDYIVRNGDFDYNHIFMPKGDSQAWLKMLKRVLFHNPKKYFNKPSQTLDDKGNVIATIYPEDDPANIATKPNVVAALVLGAAWGAPLVKPLGIRNPQMHLGFDSGHGKTALGKFAVSFYGDPDALVPKCNSTFNFLEDLSVKLNDLPYCVDELQSIKKSVRDALDELVYNFEGGITRGRADIHGNARPTYRYRGFRCFTGEQTILNDNSGNGAISRILEIKIPELFEDSFAINLHNFTRNNFAHFGKKFINDIPQRLGDIKKFFNLIRDSLTGNSKLDILSNHASIIAYSLTGLRFTLESLGFQNALDITLNVLENIDNILADAPSKTLAKNINRALPDLLNFIESHPKNFDTEIQTNGSSEFVSAIGNETWGVKFLDGRIALNPIAMKKILNTELGYPNAKVIIEGFGRAGYIVGNDTNRYHKHMKRLPEEYNQWKGHSSSWFYILKPSGELEAKLATTVAA